MGGSALVATCVREELKANRDACDADWRASSLLFPHLLGSRRSTLLAVVTSVVMAQLAAELNEISTKALIFAQIYVIFWLQGGPLITGANFSDRLVALARKCYRHNAKPPRAGILWYFARRFLRRSLRKPHLSSTLICFGLSDGRAISQTRPEHPIGPWLFVAIIFVAGRDSLRPQHASTRATGYPLKSFSFRGDFPWFFRACFQSNLCISCRKRVEVDFKDFSTRGNVPLAFGE